MQIPDGLKWLSEEPGGDAWLRSLPQVLRDCAQRWSLDLGSAYESAYVAYVAQATAADGTPVVLKIQVPHPECTYEAEALRVWNGRGAVMLLEHAPERNALLLERCEPGTSLAHDPSVDVHALLLRLLPRVLVPAGAPFTSIHDEVARWTEDLEQARRVQAGALPSLVPRALETLTALTSTQGEVVLVNQDLHRDNVLRSEREDWLIIDPKPLLAEPELALANRLPMFGTGEIDQAAPGVGDRLDRLCGALGLRPERARAWAFVRSVAWAACDDRHRSAFTEVAQRLASRLER